MNLLLTVVCFAGIAAVNLPGMIKKKLWHDLAVYSAVYLAVFILAVLVALDIKIPSPIKAIQTFYREILHLSFKIS